jgi:tetratricopeptide (TPR) repeat protein
MTEAPLGRATLCLSVGDVPGAVAALQDAVVRIPEFAEAHQLLGGLCLGSLDDYGRAREHFEIALRLHRERGDVRTAARCAIVLSVVEATDDREAARSEWLDRARGMLDELGPCVEEGYYRIARRGFEVLDVTALEVDAAAALEVAERFGDTELEIRARAERGLALVSLGRTAEGIVMLEEASVAAIAGGVRTLGTWAMTCCALVTTCYRLRDLERLTRLVDEIRHTVRERFHAMPQPMLTAQCRGMLGGLLAEAGRWEEAETELQEAIATTACAGHRAAAAAHLALLRVHQGRLDKAAELLCSHEDRPEIAGALARLQDARDELELAASTLHQALLDHEGNLVLSAPLLGHLVDVERRRGDIEAADRAAVRLESIAATLASHEVSAMALLGRGRVTQARGEDGGRMLLAALRELQGLERPHLRAEVHLSLADTSIDLAAAIAYAREAFALFTRLGARRDADRAAAVLHSFGVMAPTDAAEDSRSASR